MARDTEAKPADPNALPEVLQFMRLLWGLVHTLDRRSKKMSQEIGVTGPQRLALRVVGLFPGISAGQLAAILHIHPSTLTGVLQRLIDQGLLERTAASTDRRRAQLRLTPSGKKVNQPSTGTVEAAVASALRKCSTRERAAAQRVIITLSTHLGRDLEFPD
jgi:DNA-binding MarR family transcriptional regulator